MEVSIRFFIKINCIFAHQKNLIMNKYLLLYVSLLITVGSLLAQNLYNEDGIRLYHTPSQEEIEWGRSKGFDTLFLVPTPPPVGELRPIAEFEPAEAVLIRYPFGIPMSLIKEMAEDCKVITIVANTSQQTTVLNQYTSNGVNTANCKFLIAATNTYWTRDFGPWFMAVDNQEVAMFDFTYNRPRPADNQINTLLANFLSAELPVIQRYASSYQLTGGNFMNDGIKQAASTTLTLAENGNNEPQIKAHFLEYMGIEQFHFMADCIVPYDNIQHIDCWSKIVAPNKVLVDSVAPGAPNYNKFEAAANYFRSLTSSWGMPFQVYRLFAPGATSSNPRTPYSNSLILNNKVFVAIGGNSYDAAALAVYQQAMPGYTIIPVAQLSSEPWLNTDALHCRTHEIADRCMLYVKHQPLFGEIENTGSVTFSAETYSYCNNTIIYDSLYVRVNGGAYTGYNMDFKGVNTWEATVSGLPSGLVEYYIVAKDASGRRECHPYIGAPDPHKFNLVSAPNLPVLAIDKINSSVTSEDFTVIEDIITLSNVGEAELTFEIEDIKFIEFLTISPMNGTIPPAGNQIITLSYNFDHVENGTYAGNFTLNSNDPIHLQTNISLTALQILPVLDLSKTSSSVSADELIVVEDFISIANFGDRDLTFEIKDIDFNELLTIMPLSGTVDPDNSLEITLFYDFRTIAKGLEYSGSFKLLCNDLFHPETEITLYAYLNNSIEEQKLSLIYIYPNPASDKMVINFNGDHATQAYIYNFLGKPIQEFMLKTGYNSVDVRELPIGIYFLHIEGRVFKFVKQ
jgi:agmatine/peptidylarginine deiminase